MPHEDEVAKYTDEDGIFSPPTYSSSIEILRLRWEIKDAPPFECVKVIDDVEDAASAQRPFRNARDGSFHEISTASFCDPPVKLFTLQIIELDGYPFVDDNLDDEHEVESNPDRPLLDITSHGEEYISIRQYIEQVHPWLLSVKDEYFSKLGSLMTGRKLPARTQLWFDPISATGIEFFDSVTTTPLSKEWEGVARGAFLWNHGHYPEDDPEGDYPDVDPEESMEDFMKRVREREEREAGIR
ncbi:hypothetical protein NQ176_g4944 [Zarea fungicola]|uniref:Uncharacterized protein n=1 Tax=Zarea fungicola TaxID=93591 RepID=A0ACC1NBQ7_9HYPO|nr:hypothetical protein NQ176_g4944 [Lecanicillium fungicola]